MKPALDTDREKARAERVMAALDKQPPEIKEIVGEYGLRIVMSCIGAGMTTAAQIKQACENLRASRDPLRREDV